MGDSAATRGSRTQRNLLSLREARRLVNDVSCANTSKVISLTLGDKCCSSWLQPWFQENWWCITNRNFSYQAGSPKFMAHKDPMREITCCSIWEDTFLMWAHVKTTGQFLMMPTNSLQQRQIFRETALEKLPATRQPSSILGSSLVQRMGKCGQEYCKLENLIFSLKIRNTAPRILVTKKPDFLFISFFSFYWKQILILIMVSPFPTPPNAFPPPNPSESTPFLPLIRKQKASKG